MNSRSGRARRNKRPSPTWNGTPLTQQRHPPATSPMATPSTSVASSAASRPISPNSLTSTAQRSPAGFCASSERIRLVLPTPGAADQVCGYLSKHLRNRNVKACGSMRSLPAGSQAPC